MSEFTPEDFNDEMDEEMTVSLNLDDGRTVVCSILTILTVRDKDYIALQPLDEEGNADGDDVWFYGYSENPNDPNEEPTLSYIEDDDELDEVIDKFDEYLDELDFEDR